LASTVCSYLWFKSRYVPRGLAVFGLMSSAWCVICAFVFIVFPQFDTTVNAYWFDVPMTIFEMVLGVYLLFTKSNPSRTAA
jgi:predicted PurR-regulated permease PerM